MQIKEGRTIAEVREREKERDSGSLNKTYGKKDPPTPIHLVITEDTLFCAVVLFLLVRFYYTHLKRCGCKCTFWFYRLLLLFFSVCVCVYVVRMCVCESL